MSPLRRLMRFSRRLKRFFQTLPKGIKGVQDQIVQMQGDIDKINTLVNATNRAVLFGAVGRALTSWSKMEEYLVIIVGGLLRVPPAKAGLIMYSILNFSVWLTLIHDLFEMDETLRPFQKRWNKISERIRKIKDRRDQLAHHSVIMNSKDKDEPALIKSSDLDVRQKAKLQQAMSHAEVVTFTDAVLDIGDDLSALIAAMRDAVEPSLEKSRTLETDHSPESGAQ